jgi:putative ABC transport system permease protein
MAPVLTYPEFLTTNQDFITLIARRAPQAPHASIDREIADLAAHAYQTIPSDDVGPDVVVSGAARPLSEVRVRPDARRAAGLVLAGGLILYMLALANLTALHMSRAVARRRESAVTLALGASVAAVWRSLTKEGAVVVTAGAVIALGGLVAWFNAAGAIDPLRTLGRGAFGTFTAVTLDARVLGWWTLVTLMTVAVAAAVPAAWAARRTTLADLRAGARGSATTGLSWHRPGAPAIILGVEAALAVVLVVAAAQLLDSYRRMQGAPIGVDADRVLTFEVQPSERTVPAEAAPGFIDRVLDAVRSVPGVESASVDGGAPLTGSASAQLHIVGRPDPIDGPPLVLRHYVGTEHFTTLGIPLRAGRAFTDADRAGAPGAVIISERAAHLYFPAGDALGQRVWFGSSTMTSPATAGEIVGIAGDVTYHPLLGEQTTASFYTPYKQFTYGWRVYFVKVTGDPMAMAPAITEAVAHVAPDLPLLQVRSLHDVLAASSRAPKDAAHGTALLAVLGLLLAAGGIWAVVSHAMAQRTREVAIRMAHGATRCRIMGLVFTDGLTWPVAGLLLGTVISLAASGVLQSLLYAVTPGDPRLVVAGACVFVVVAAAACVAPAWRATRVNAVDVLRAD